MKVDPRKLFRLAATGAAGCSLANFVHAASVLTGTDLGSNAEVPASHGSFLAGTPNIGVTWNPTGASGWQAYADGFWTNVSALNETGTGLYQVDDAIEGATYSVVFTPDVGFNAVLSSIDFNVYNGGGDFNINWSIVGATSGTLGSGLYVATTGANTTLDFGGIVGSASEELTLELEIGAGSGTASYLAVDNLAFDQVVSMDPLVTAFTSDKAYIDNPVTLSWSIVNPDSGMTVTLDDGTAPLDVTGDTNLTTGDGSIAVNPTANTTYTLSVGGSNGLELEVLLGEALSLSSNPSLTVGPAYETTLSWEIRPVDAELVTIFDGTTTIDVTADTDPLTGIGSRVVSVSDPSTVFVVDANDSGNTAETRVLREQVNSAAFSLDSSAITTEGTLNISWEGAAAGPTDWVAIYQVGQIPGVEFSTQWFYLNGTKDSGAGTAPSDGSLSFSGLGAGEYFAVLLLNDGYEIAQGPVLFEVTEAPVVPDIIRVESIVRNGDNLTIEWESKAGFEYDIYASDTLEGDPIFDWDVVEIAWPTEGDGTTSFTEDLSLIPGGVPLRRFYRIYDVEVVVP